MRTIRTPAGLTAPWEDRPARSATPSGQEGPEPAAVSVAEPPAEAGASSATETMAVVADGQVALVQVGEEEKRLLDSIYAIQREILAAEAEEQEINQRLDELRDELKVSREAKAELLETLPVRLIKLRDGLDVAPSKPTVAEVEPSQAEQAESSGWRSRPTDSILDGVSHLGPMKRDALCERYPTLGELADARARAYANRKHFATELPPGVGRKPADEIEDRLMEAESADGVPPASQVVEPRVPAEEKRRQWVRAMVKTIEAGETRESLRSERNETWDEGYESAADDALMFDVPESLTEEHQMHWLRGWVAYSLDQAAAELQHELKTEPAPPPASSDEQDAATDEQAAATEEPGDDPQPAEFDLESLAELIKSSGSYECQHNREAWMAGCEAEINGQPLQAIPSSLVGPAQADWIRGWLDSANSDI